MIIQSAPSPLPPASPPRERIDHNVTRNSSQRIDRAGTPNRAIRGDSGSDNWSKLDQEEHDAQFARQVDEYEQFRQYTLDSITQLRRETKENTRQLQQFNEMLKEIKKQISDLAPLVEKAQQNTVRQLFNSEPPSHDEGSRGLKRTIPVHGSAVAQRYNSKARTPNGRPKPLNEKEIPSDVLVYTGMNSEVSLQRWYTKILLWQAILDWTDRQTLQCMCLRVSGEAATYIERGDVIGPDTTPEELCEMFAANFSNTATELSLSLNLDSIHMQPNETVNDYNARFIKAVSQVGNVDESRKLIAYIKGLRENYRQVIALTHPTTLAGAMQSLSLTNAFHQATNVGVPLSTTSLSPASVTPVTQAINPDFAQLLQSMSQNITKLTTAIEQRPNKTFYKPGQGQNANQGSKSTGTGTNAQSTRPTSQFSQKTNMTPRVNMVVEESPPEEQGSEEEDSGNA